MYPESTTGTQSRCFRSQNYYCQVAFSPSLFPKEPERPSSIGNRGGQSFEASQKIVKQPEIMEVCSTFSSLQKYKAVIEGRWVKQEQSIPWLSSRLNMN